MTPLLIAELGLHGEGQLEYHTSIVDQIVREWTGWPPIMIKTQTWGYTTSPWASAIRMATRRSPLDALSADRQRHLAAYCHDRGLLYGVTIHDTSKLIDPGTVDYIKLGSFDLTQPDVVEFAVSQGVPLIVSEGLTKAPSDLGAERKMWCVSKYPANVAPAYAVEGFSCHSVPSLVETHVLQAAPHAWTIEVHVTDRPQHVRPLPADMCVSVGVAHFMEIARALGEVWSAA